MRIRTFGGLWIEGPPPVPALGPRRLALLALVAAAGRRGISRDRVIGILWPDAPEDQARHTLSQTIYTLKKDTGRDWIIPGAELRLDPGIGSEIGELKDALASGGFEVVEGLASGVFLDGFYLAGAPEFERWVEEERSKLKSAVARAVEQFASRADASPDHAAAIRGWTLLTELEPLSARYAVGRMKALAAAGDRASALAHARTYEEQVRRELETDVDPAVRQLVAALRAEVAPAPVASGTPSPSEATTPHASGLAAPLPRSGPFPRAALALLAPLALAGAFLLLRPDRSNGIAVLAVGDIGVELARDTTQPGSVLRDMLATSLSGIEGLQVVANSRLVELLPRGGEGPPGTTSDAARRAGATEVIEGELTAEGSGLVLSLRRVTLSNGVLRKGYVIRAADRYAIVDSAARTIARDLGLARPAAAVADIRTSSPEAYALYDEGLRANYGYDAPAAYRLMSAALARDSNFAMAAFYVWTLGKNLHVMGDSTTSQALERVKRLVPRTIERERLLIQATVAATESPLAIGVAIAETLAVRYPTDPDGQILLAEARGAQGDWQGAVEANQRAFVLDSAAGAVSSPYCRMCAAVGLMANAYMWADSAAAAERVTHQLLAVRADKPAAYGNLIEPMLRQGKRQEAEATIVRWALGNFTMSLRRDLIRWGRYEEVDRALVEDVGSLDFDTRADAWWLLLLSLRDQGRLMEADTLIHLQRVGNTNRLLAAPSKPPVDLALLAMEMGKPAISSRALHENIAGIPGWNVPAAVKARNHAWHLVLEGTAHAAAGDTATVRRLADSIDVVSRQSPWARDTRLQYMLRGLLLQREGRHAEAVESFRRSFYSLTYGYTRTNLMMARSLLALRRPAEAIAVLRPAIHGGVDGGNTYVSRTELHEALAQAFEMAGQADSARAHWRSVESAWRRADPQFKARYETARAKVLAPKPTM